MSAHTTGAWQPPYQLTNSWGVYSHDGTPLAKVTREADARLIAAAPELLEALQQMRRWMPVYPAAADGIVGGREAHAAAMAAANAAIAKATGEQA